MLFAGEYSGNVYGAAVARELKQLCPRLHLSGTGCREMEMAGVDLHYDCTGWGGIGFVEALKVLPRLYFVYRKLCQRIERERPRALVFIDYPGFNMFLARFAHRLEIPTLYYFPPGKFSREPEELAETARIITTIAAPFKFTYDVYQRAGASVEFVGHPLADVLSGDLSKAAAKKSLGLAREGPLIGLLPGSRRREIRVHTPMLVQCAKQIAASIPEARFVIPLPDLPGSRMDSLRRFVERSVEQAEAQGAPPIAVHPGGAHSTMVAADLLLIASGTATLEATWFGTPMVIIYKASWLTEFLARRIFYAKLPDHFGLPNIIAGRMAVPEFIQREFTRDNIAGEAIRILQDTAYRSRLVEELNTLREDLSKPGTSRRVAELALELSDGASRKGGTVS